jgi:hypothetical protein
MRHTLKYEAMDEALSAVICAAPHQDLFKKSLNGGATTRFAAVTLLMRVSVVFFWMWAMPLLMTAQSIDDGLRHTQFNTAPTARMAALGAGYIGVADDFGALYSNPAGLTLLPLAEFSAGLQATFVRNRTTYFGQSTDWSASPSFALSHIGLALPIRGRDLTLCFALGFSRENEFSDADSVIGFNPSSSIVQQWVRSQNGADLTTNRAWQLALADTVRGRFITPLTGNLTQAAFTQQSGGMNAFTLGGAFDIGTTFSFGASVLFSFGNYTYTRDYQETDTQNRYNRLDVINFTTIDFTNLTVRDSYTQQIGGVRAVLGGQARIGDNVRVSLAATTPGAYQITESYSSNSVALFDNGDTKRYGTGSQSGTGDYTYTVTTPWKFAGGVSVHFSGLTATIGGEYVNLQEMKFAPSDGSASSGVLNDLNANLRRVLVGQPNVGVGAEYEIPNAPVVVRGSVTYLGSPYQQSSLQASATILAAGAGVYLAPNTRLDAMYRFYQRSYQTDVDGSASYQGTQNFGQASVQIVTRF